MEEPALLVREETLQRTRSVPVIRSTIGLEVVDADLGARVQVPPRLGEQRLAMARPALARAVEDLVTACSGAAIELPAGGVGAGMLSW